MVRIWKLLLNIANGKNHTSTTSAAISIAVPETAVASTDQGATDRRSELVALQQLIRSTNDAIEADKLNAIKTEQARFKAAATTVAADVKSQPQEANRSGEDIPQTPTSSANTTLLNPANK